MTPTLRAQSPSALAKAKALDQEIEQAEDLPDGVRPQAIRDLALRVRQMPVRYLPALAFNLAASTSEANGHDTLESVAATLADAIRRSPPRDIADDLYRVLAELVRYGHTAGAVDDERYRKAVAQLDADDQHRQDADFSLADLSGRTWNLKSLRGKVVLVNFWATWCPPCRQEVPDLEELYRRFEPQGLVVLAISGEDASAIKKFLFQQKASYPILLDHGQVTDLFRVRGIPRSFVFDREGHLAGETIDRPSRNGWLELLRQAGLR